MTLHLELPMPENLANARLHWRVKENARQAYYETCDLMVAAKLIPKPPAKPFARCTLTSEMVVGGAMDDDNAMARHKWALDWLRDRGYVANDTKSNLKWAGLPSQIVSRKQRAVLRLTLTPIREAA